MTAQNENLISTIRELIKESLKESAILLDSPRQRKVRAINEKKNQRGKRGK